MFNFEGGCYAKVIQLSPTAEPEIYATHAPVRHDPRERRLRSGDAAHRPRRRERSPRTRAPRTRSSSSTTPCPRSARATRRTSSSSPATRRASCRRSRGSRVDQALYQFISGYTSKIAGTEVGPGQGAGDHLQHLLRRAVHGAPARLLRAAAEGEGACATASNCWLVNTGWVGGPYGVGKRISIRYTRAMLNAALERQARGRRVQDRSDLRVPGAEDLPGRARPRARSGQRRGRTATCTSSGTGSWRRGSSTTSRSSTRPRPARSRRSGRTSTDRVRSWSPGSS